MQPPLPSVTATWHNQSYEAISPTRPELSAQGKTVIIIGAGSGIGRATAVSFARAGASKLVLIGRNETRLVETQQSLACSSSIHAISITDEAALSEVATSVGPWDVLILAAGYLSDPASIRTSSTDDWWQSFETNVKGPMIASKVFLPTAHATNAAIVALTSAVVFPTQMLVGLSAYVSSKLALLKFVEFLAAENPNLFAVSVQPGMVETDIFRKSGANASLVPVDQVDLPADFLVWLTSPEATFLNGRQVWSNWDVEELKKKAEEIQSGSLLTAGIYGWPFQP
ncbi:SDR family NAD(P)-dependent oxidoreductase [Aspergillus clavatus NRRL 1]|uniref:NADP(+)-dependent dehydrogenase, putative n=1 Tax=Aspergillus clavatus (strain ATCC 1007 / CBS 513.65 / DSM 816 / NCTC 3887 / NRRL 1 / QM 1276 / 107) TaxID=344612 RepID=A1C4K4_ASPCL|nr:NADP(+)-dependent dehydrogenase, putative [Aspergillus clavatus NRRL 1]EAW15344.1 NADP(+)-dependent dehydrogenase, putative [Aspergillus clavatus NRRL 1]